MTRYLMAISIGPVQGFIAAARRTRDFWMGSTILSEVAKAVARWIAQLPPPGDTPLDRLIFPAPRDMQELAPWEFSRGGKPPEEEFNVTNVILAMVKTDDPRQFAEQARDRAEEKWDEFLQFIESLDRDPDNRSKPGPFTDVDKVIWAQQRGQRHDVLEFYSAWVECPEAQAYRQARRQVMRLLNARKACRNFQPWAGIPLRPKNSLDAGRESVLVPPEERRSDLRVKRSEQLDVVGMAKRVEFGNDSIRYPSVSRFAADPWIRGLTRTAEGRGALDQLMGLCDQLVKDRALRRRKPFHGKPKENDTEKFRWLSTFPFEGTPLYVDRHPELLQDLPRNGEDEETFGQRKAEVRDRLGEVAAALERLRCEFGRPSPYFALLAADGDAMGATIARLNDQAAHRAFSLAQTKFADQVRKRINNPVRGADDIPDQEKFRGATVYAGADDVLAFVPLDQCLRCARVMHDLFARTLRTELSRKAPQALEALDRAGAFPKLSVGVAVGHFLEPLEDLLHYARGAENRAKKPTREDRDGGQGPRNGLAVAIHPRGGAPFTVRGNWQDGAGRGDSLDERVARWAELHRNKWLPTKAAYDLRRLARDYGGTWTNADDLAAALQSEALRLLRRKRSAAARPARPDGLRPEEEGEEAVEAVKAQVRTLIAKVRTAADLEAVANELIVGQWIGDALNQSEGRPPTGREGEDAS